MIKPINSRCFLILGLVLAAGAWTAEESAPKKVSAEERKRKFEALKKELEAFRPAADAAPEELLAFVQQTISLSSRFAKDNPQSAEGFEAAFNAAMLLASQQHPRTGEVAQVAIDTAPTAGVDQRQLATCWVLVAYGKLIKNEVEEGRAALEKVKPLDAELYERAKAQLEAVETQKKK